MEYKGLRRSSKTFNTLVTSIEETRVINVNDEHEVSIDVIDHLLHFILKELKFIDPKFNFLIRNLSSIDSENRSIRQYHYFLIWKELSKSNVCKLANDDGYFASIELLKDPKSWSKYDLDAHIVKVDRKRYLNGLSLRDDLVKCLMEFFKNNSYQQVFKELNFKEIEFDQSTIRLIFTGSTKASMISSAALSNTNSTINNNTTTNFNLNTNLTQQILTPTNSTTNFNLNNNNQSLNSTEIGIHIQEDEVSLRSQTPSISQQHNQSQQPQQQQQQQQQQPSSGYSKVIYVLNLNTMISFTNATPILLNHMKESLGHHDIFKEYFDHVFEAKFYLLTYNSFKWVYDVVYIEHLLFEYLLEQKSLFTNAYKKLILIKRSWRKYFQKVLKIVENIKINERLEKRRSTVMSTRSDLVRTSLSLFSDSFGLQNYSLSYQLETSIERTFNEYLFRVLFLRQCAANKILPDNREQFNSIIITNIFEELLVVNDKKYCESFSFKYKNILPKCCLYFEPAIQTGIVKIIKEIYLDWKRGRFGH